MAVFSSDDVYKRTRSIRTRVDEFSSADKPLAVVLHYASSRHDNLITPTISNGVRHEFARNVNTGENKYTPPVLLPQ